MSIAGRFFAYAIDFEKTFIDDDWSRLLPHLRDDVRYSVENASVACELHGRDVVLHGIRKSLEGFDRRVDSRVVSHHGEPRVSGHDLEVDWVVTYSKTGAPDFHLAGATAARIEDDLVARFTDRFADGVGEALDTWTATYAPGLDISYTE